MTVEKAEAAGVGSREYGVRSGSGSGSGSESDPTTLNPTPYSASEASSERVRRYPIPFTRAGERWVAAQTALFDLEPLRLVVSEPREDAVLRLLFGTVEFLFRQWRLGEGEIVHSKELHSWGSPDDPVVWKPGELARIEVLAGTISGAAFVARKKGTS